MLCYFDVHVRSPGGLALHFLKMNTIYLRDKTQLISGCNEEWCPEWFQKTPFFIVTAVKTSNLTSVCNV
jgi:hypothetical protein